MFKFFKKWVAELKDGPVDWDELEATLIQSDLGLELTEKILADLKNQPLSSATIRAAVSKTLIGLWPKPPSIPSPRNSVEVWWLIGINGAGKTTTLAKLGALYRKRGNKVHVVGADTFRAAAGQQLKIWADRLGLSSTIGPEGMDPGAAAFSGIEEGIKLGANLILIDTAGRLHNKENLMRELEKVRRVIQGKNASSPEQTLLVVDGANGTNALSQAREFHKALGLTGVIVTKLDSSAKGGVVAALKAEQNLDTLWIGSGEAVEDLAPFDPAVYAERFFGNPE